MKSFRDLVCIQKEQGRVEMLEAIGFDFWNEVLGLNYNNLKEFRDYLNELVEKVEEENKQNETIKKVSLEK